MPTVRNPPAVPTSTPTLTPVAHERFADAHWETWGTRVVLRLTDPDALGPARAAVEHELDAIDRACSRFRSDSEIARLNASEGRAISVSPLLVEALALALRAARLTDGDVDPTVGSALILSGYDRDWRLLDPPDGDSERSPRHETAPTPAVLAQAVCGWRNLTLDRTHGTVRIPAGFAIDLGATAKAWAADRAAHVAATTGDCGALVGIGGDIATSGPAPACGWAVRVTDDHRSDHRAPGQTVSIHSGGLATSSTAVRRWSHRGQTMHHIIDPTTGAPVRGTWRTVSAAAASCADANIVTTCALIRAWAAPAWLAKLKVPARLVSSAGRVYTIGSWPTNAVPAQVSTVPARDEPQPEGPQPTVHRR